MSAPQLWVRIYSWTWLDHVRSNLMSSGWHRGDAGLIGFDIHEHAQDYNRSRHMAALTTCRRLGFVARPGIVWNIASGQADPHQKWREWLNPIAWSDRSALITRLSQLQDPARPGIAIDFEMYGSLGDKCPPMSRTFELYRACESLQSAAGTARILAYPAVPYFPQNIALEKRLRNLAWLGQNQFNLARKVDDEPALRRDLDDIVIEDRTYQQWGDGFSPGIDQDLLRDWAAPVRQALAHRLITDAWIFLDASQDDFLHFGSSAWRQRPKEPAAPPDPASTGLMAFDLDVSDLDIGPTMQLIPRPGSIVPTFAAVSPATIVREPLEPSASDAGQRSFVLFNGVAGQGYRAALGRQLSADYTLAFVGRPPHWNTVNGNDGTGWQLGPHRFRVAQSPTGRWEWGHCFAPLDAGRHVIVCEQEASGRVAIIMDGVEASRVTELSPPQPDGSMSIGNTDALTSRPCRMELERLTVWEGVNRMASLKIAREYCSWHNIAWRGEA